MNLWDIRLKPTTRRSKYGISDLKPGEKRLVKWDGPGQIAQFERVRHYVNDWHSKDKGGRYKVDFDVEGIVIWRTE
jgi:hypothetical protein